ncbi:hypothetical protein D3C71_1684120 [compost metagenome]
MDLVAHRDVELAASRRCHRSQLRPQIVGVVDPFNVFPGFERLKVPQRTLARDADLAPQLGGGLGLGLEPEEHLPADR